MDLVVHTWAEWCRVFNKVDVWRPLVEAICLRHGLASSPCRPGFEGTNAVFIAGESAVVKIVSPFFRNDYRRELEVYHLLEGDASLPTPRVLAEGVLEGAQPWPYMVLSLLPGERLGAVWASVPRENQVAIAARLGRLIRRLHEQPLDGVRSMDTSRENWERFVAGQMERAPAHFRAQGLPAHLLDALPAYLSSLLPLFPADFPPRLLSADLTEDHTLLGQAKGRWEITGLIDFGDAEVGHADLDFVAVHLFCFHGDRELTGVFLAGYGYALDERFNERMMGYSLLHRFADMRPWLKELGGAERVRSWEELQQHLWRVSPRACGGSSR